MSKKHTWRGDGWGDPPSTAPGFNYPYGFPLDHVPVTPTGRIYKIRRALRRAFNAAMIAAATIAAFLWGFS